ncbi:MAG TPA: thiamine phosphate synthase [Thermoanaerobaculia bacterium]|jgi:thiamine-phosphate pyrophosphorylase|nr:thiamine phosphate synthase [Thermoanaerobaculia bacterium]
MKSAVYAIADAGALGAESLPAAVAEMAAGGIGWIQVRAKELSGSGWYAALDGCCRALEGSGVRLWVDDRADLAALFPVDGLHVGQRDLPPAAARRVVGREVRIGLSTHDEAQLAAADADPDVDVIAVGPVFATTGKANPDPVVGLDFVRRARERTRKPLVAIGGIDDGNLAAVLAAGADSAVVLGAVCRGGVREVRANCRRLMIAAGAAEAAGAGE